MLATTSTTHLACKTSQNRLRLVGFIDNSRFSCNLTNVWARGLVPPTTRHILYDSSSSQARGLDTTRLSAYKHAMILWILYSKPWGFGFKHRGLQGHVSSVTYFLNLLGDKDRRLETKLTSSLILRVNLRLRATPYGVRVQITAHIKEDSTTTQGMSTS
jgi:hypothetical protein